MGEQNRRAVEVEGTPGDAAAPHSPPAPAPAPGEGGGHTEADGTRALPPDADERQTRRQAPDNASPGEGAEGDSIG